jgi:hypothetical protein
MRRVSVDSGGKFLLFAFLGIGVAAIFILTRKPVPQVALRQIAGPPSHLPLGIPVAPAAPAGNVLYQNTETWDIDWNQDGLPEKVTIHRKVVRG